MRNLKRVFYLSETLHFNSVRELSDKLKLSDSFQQCREVGFVQLDNNEIWCAALLDSSISTIDGSGELAVEYRLLDNDSILLNYILDGILAEVKLYQVVPDWLRFATSCICKDPSNRMKECFPFSSSEATIERLLEFNNIWSKVYEQTVEHNYFNEYFDTYDEDY